MSALASQAGAGPGRADDDTDELTAVPLGPPRQTGFPARLVAAQLAADPRMAGWRRRAIIATAAGLAGTLLVDWRAGVTIAALVAAADTIARARTIALSPADARLAAAQGRTRRRLVAARPWGYVALHARPVPGTASCIDHLVIGPGGVFAVDSERWDRRLAVRTAAASSAAGPVLYHGPHSQKDRLQHARWEAAQAAWLLQRELGEPVTVQPVMIIYGPQIPWQVARLRGVDVLPGRQALRYFAGRRRAAGAGALSWDASAAVAAAAERALPRPG